MTDSLSRRLMSAMTEAKLSAAQLAIKVGATEATISNWLNDKVQQDHAKAALLLKISAATGVHPMWLLFGQGRRHAGSNAGGSAEDRPESHPLNIETLTIAVQLVAEALKGFTLPPPKLAEVTTLVYELLEEGMPEAKVLRFARAAAA